MKPANKFAVSYNDSAELILQNLRKKRNRELILKFLLFLFLFPLSAFASSPIDYENNPKFEEILRIKIWNQPGGSVEVSSDEGKTWETAGKVIYPTIKTNPEGYAASRWVADGKVAATAVNAIHIKTATGSDETGIIFSLLPKEFLHKPKVYRSYLSPDSSIYTDIPAGERIFGGGFSPFVGNIVMLSRPAAPVIPIPRGYVPAVGDKIYIIVDRPVDYPKEIIFENRLGGAVSIAYFSGGSRTIGQVLRPVAGIGRFEGTKYAGVGRIRADHAGVIDVSTSGLGEIGGFQIIPSQHSSNLQYTGVSSQWMVIGPTEGDTEAFEGKAPFFKYFIRPSYAPDDLESKDWENRLLNRFLVEVKLKGSEKWQPMPVLEFDGYYLTGELPNRVNTALSNITHLRILFPIL